MTIKCSNILWRSVFFIFKTDFYVCYSEDSALVRLDSKRWCTRATLVNYRNDEGSLNTRARLSLLVLLSDVTKNVSPYITPTKSAEPEFRRFRRYLVLDLIICQFPIYTETSQQPNRSVSLLKVAVSISTLFVVIFVHGINTDISLLYASKYHL